MTYHMKKDLNVKEWAVGGKTILYKNSVKRFKINTKTMYIVYYTN